MSILNIAIGLTGAGEAINAVKEVGNTMVDTAVQADRMNMMMKASSAEVDVAGKKFSTYDANMKFLSDTSNKLGLNLMETSKAFAQLTVATNGTSLEGEKAEKIFNAVAKANQSLGGSTADLNGMLNALTQMVSKGTVQMEELRGQLGDRLPGTLKMAAEGMGVTTQELIKMIGEGRVAAEDFLPKLAAAIDNTYKNERFDTAQANINRLDNSWTKFKQHVVDSDAVNSAIKSVTNTIEIAARNSSNALDDQIAHAQQRIKTFKESQTLQVISSFTGYDPNVEKNKLDSLLKQKDAQDNLNKSIKDAETQQSKNAPTIVNADELAKSKTLHEKTQNEILALTAHATDNKVEQIHRLARLEEKKAADDVANAKLTGERLNEAVADLADKRAAIRAKESVDVQSELEKQDKHATVAANKAQKQIDNQLERARDFAGKMKAITETSSAQGEPDKVTELEKLKAAEQNKIDETLRNAKLTGKLLVDAEREAGEAKLAISKEYEEKIRKEREKTAEEADKKAKAIAKYVTSYEDAASTEIANIQNNRIERLKMQQKAELQVIQDKYEQALLYAKGNAKEIEKVEASHKQLLEAKEVQHAQQTARTQGDYSDLLKAKMQDRFDNQISMNEMLADSTLTMADGMASSFADLALSGKNSFADMAVSVIRSIEAMIFKMLIMKAIGAAMGAWNTMGATGDASTGESFGVYQSDANVTQANGGVWNQGVQMFAQGGIVNSPTMFGHSGGLGIMGEAGPEAIVPLSGGRSIPVEMKGNGGGISVGNINVTVTAAKDENADDTGTKVGQAIRAQLEQLVEKKISNATRSGNTLNPTAITAF